MTIEYDTNNCVETPEQLEALYGKPSERSLVKELDHVSEHYGAFIAAAPFVVIASVGPDGEGVDTSPRGDAPGFVRIQDSRTLLLPDRRGNNRADTLMNVVRDGRVSLLFLIPGAGETLRVIGNARINIDPGLCESFAVNGKPARSVLVIDVKTVYFQCQKALARSRLWSSEAQIERGELPTAGQILQALDTEFDGVTYDKNYPEYLQETIY